MVDAKIDFDQIQRERLPTLYEVLIMKTSAPVDLWSFYTYLSQFPYAINYLDFWIDLMAHIRLCKDYVRNVRRSITMRPATDEFRSNGNKHPTNGRDDASLVSTSALMDTLVSEGYLDFDNPERVCDFLQGNTHTSPVVTKMIQNWKNRNERPSSGMRSHNDFNSKGAIAISESDSRQSITAIVDSFLKNQAKNGEKGNITTKQLYSNAVQICHTYLESPNISERYLTNIPETIKNEILSNVKVDKRYDLDVFQELKEMTYQFLEIDCFPKFLKEVALHNIHDEISDWRFHPNSNSTTRPPNALLEKDGSPSLSKGVHIHTEHISWSPFSTFSALSRVLFGCLWMGIGFWIGYTLIFIHYNRAIRVTTVVPFGIGGYFLICGIYQLDIIYSWFGVTQKLIYTHTKGSDRDTSRTTYDSSYNTDIPSIFLVLGGKARLIRVEHPFIKRMLYKRGLWCLILVIIWTACFTVIFSCVPGRRL